jgi:hypothetical protein
MDAQPQRNNRRRRRKNPNNSSKKEPAAEPVFIAARRPGSPRIEKPTRRMKAASARPRTAPEGSNGAREVAKIVEAIDDQPKKRDVRIVQRKLDEVDDSEKLRRKLFASFMSAEGRAAITRTANEYLTAGFSLPREQEAQLKLLEHFDEAKARAALTVLAELLSEESPRQLPVFRQRLRRLEDYADDATIRTSAAELRKLLPG